MSEPINNVKAKRRSSKRGVRIKYSEESSVSGLTCQLPYCGISFEDTDELENHHKIHLEQELAEIDKVRIKRPRSSTAASSLRSLRSETYSRLRERRIRRTMNISQNLSGCTLCQVCMEEVEGTVEQHEKHVRLCIQVPRESSDDFVELDDVDEDWGDHFEQYEWAGQSRVRATSLMGGGLAGAGFQTIQRTDEDEELDVTGDSNEDNFGEVQYTETDLVQASGSDSYLAGPNPILGSTLPHANLSSGSTLPHANPSSDSTLPHANLSSDSTLPHANLSSDSTLPHANLTSDSTLPAPNPRLDSTLADSNASSGSALSNSNTSSALRLPEPSPSSCLTLDEPSPSSCLTLDEPRCSSTLHESKLNSGSSLYDHISSSVLTVPDLYLRSASILPYPNSSAGLSLPAPIPSSGSILPDPKASSALQLPGSTTSSDSIPPDSNPISSSEKMLLLDSPDALLNVDQESETKDIAFYKRRILGLETSLRTATDMSTCRVCMDTYRRHVVSTACWHVHCEACWILTLAAKKLCPQCKTIVKPTDLRRIYL